MPLPDSQYSVFSYFRDARSTPNALLRATKKRSRRADAIMAAFNRCLQRHACDTRRAPARICQRAPDLPVSRRRHGCRFDSQARYFTDMLPAPTRESSIKAMICCAAISAMQRLRRCHRSPLYTVSLFARRLPVAAPPFASEPNGVAAVDLNRHRFCRRCRRRFSAQSPICPSCRRTTPVDFRHHVDVMLSARRHDAAGLLPLRAQPLRLSHFAAAAAMPDIVAIIEMREY